MISPLSIRQGDMRTSDQNGLGRAETWTSVSPCLILKLRRYVAAKMSKVVKLAAVGRCRLTPG